MADKILRLKDENNTEVGTWGYSLENKWYYYYPANYNRFKVYYKIKYHLTPAKVVIKQKIMSTRSGLILERS